MLAFVNSARARLRPRPSFPLTYQHDSVDCGPACLRMIARHYGRTYTLQRLRELTEMDRQGVSLLGIGEAAGRIGLRTLGVRVTPEQLLTRAPLPCIAHWKQEHFVVVHAVRDDRVFVADPGAGLLTYSKKEFLQGWLSHQTGDAPCGVALLLEPTPAFYAQEEDRTAEKGGFGQLAGYLRPYRRLIAQLFVGVAAISVLQLILPFLTAALVDIGIADRDLDFVFVILAAQLMLLFSRTAVEFIQSRIVLHVGARVDISMISDFLARLMRLPAAFFDGKTTGDLLQRVRDHARVQAFLSTTSLNVLLSLLSLVVFGVVLAAFSGSIFLVFFGGSLLYTGYVAAFLQRRKALDHKRFAHQADSQNLLIEAIDGMQDIQLNGAEQQRRWAWEHLQARLFRVSLRSLSLSQYQQGGAVLINEVKNIVVTVMAAHQVIAGHLSLGALLAVQYIIGQLNGPIHQLISFLHAAQDARLSLDRMHEVKAISSRDDTGPQRAFLPERPDLVLDGVSYRYGGSLGAPVLEDVHLTIPHGKVTAIVGTSGSGKTTLMKLLLRFHDPLGGEVRIGPTPLHALSERFWRDQCGVVLQEGRLFSDTIARNIALGVDEIDRDRLFEAARLACIQPFIESLPLAYNTRVGRDGSGLSKGQQQRLLIARALYRDPKYLFFDEATSALDAETERAITGNLQAFFEGKTVVVIAHRLSTVRRADQIVVLEQGRVVECDSHEVLVARRGRYFALVKNQLELAGEPA